MKKSMLLSTIAMIVVVVIALSTATFAWFSAQGTPAITGSLTIQATGDFELRESKSTVDAAASWKSVAGQIDITGSSKKFIPATPTTLLGDKYATHSGKYNDSLTIPALGTAGEGKWYTAYAPTPTSWTDAKYTENDQGPTVTHIQVTPADKSKAHTANVTISLYIDGKGDSEYANALNSARVVLMMSKADKSPTGVALDTQYLGTQYSYGAANGTVTFGTNGVSPQSGSSALGAATPAWGTDAPKLFATETNFTESTTKADLFPVIKPAASATKDSNQRTAEVKNEIKENNETFAAGYYRNMVYYLPFEMDQTYVISCFVWLDGQEASTVFAGKIINTNISFSLVSD